MVKCCDSFASRARVQVTIDREAVTDDGMGGQQNGWSDVGTFWAIVEPTSGRERFLSESLQSSVDHKVTIRYQDELKDTRTTASYRVTYDGRPMNVLYVRNLHVNMKTAGKAFQELFCVMGEPA